MAKPAPPAAPAATPKPPVRSAKGLPPASPLGSAAVGNYLDKPDPSKPKLVNFQTTRDFDLEMKKFAMDHDMSFKDFIHRAAREYMANHR